VSSDLESMVMEGSIACFEITIVAFVWRDWRNWRKTS